MSSCPEFIANQLIFNLITSLSPLYDGLDKVKMAPDFDFNIKLKDLSQLELEVPSFDPSRVFCEAIDAKIIMGRETDAYELFQSNDFFT